MPTIYSSLYTNFIRQGSTFAKSITTHGYAQSVVAATHPHILNSQNRPVFTRRNTSRLNRLGSFQLSSAFHTDRATAGHSSEHRVAHNHGGLDAYFENLKHEAAAETEQEWSQFEFQKRIEWKPDADTVIPEQSLEAAHDEHVLESAGRSMTPDEQAALAHIDAALQKEIDLRREEEEAELAAASGASASIPLSRARTPASIARSATPVDPHSQQYADYLRKLAADGRYAEIPTVFEAMLGTGVKPISGSYNALLMAAIHIPNRRIEIVSKALDVYADMLRRRISPDGDTYNILVGLLASRSLEVSATMSGLEQKRARFGGMEEPGKFMLASHELEHATLAMDDRLDLAVRLFDSSVDADVAQYSAETYHQLISACGQAGRVADMVRLYEHLESNNVTPFAAIFPAMISAFATSGDLISAVECYNEYRQLAIANDTGAATVHDRLDAQVYAAVIHAYVISDKMDGAVRFYEKILGEYGDAAAKVKDVLISSGMVKGLIAKGQLRSAVDWADSAQDAAQAKILTQCAVAASDTDKNVIAIEAYAKILATSLPEPTTAMAMLAMSVRIGDVSAATAYWQDLCHPSVEPTVDFIEPAAMYAVALIGSGQVVEGLTQSEHMFAKIKAMATLSADDLGEEIDEAVDFISRYMASRGIKDPRKQALLVASQQTAVFDTVFTPTTPAPMSEDSYDPYAANTDYKGSALIADNLEANPPRMRLGEALKTFKNIRRTGRHPRYITYAKLIAAAGREGRMAICEDVLSMAKTDMPLLPEHSAVKYGWSSILDAMVAASLAVGDRRRAEQFHQELLAIGCAPSANTFGQYIITLKGNERTFDEAAEAVRIFHRSKVEGIEATPFLYNALIGKLGKARRIDDCLFYFSEMRAAGLTPTSVTYGTLVNALCRVSEVQFAEELFDEMESMPNYKARAAPYNSMMQCFLTTKRDKARALAYFERMNARGIMPTSHTYKLLIDTHATLDPVDMAAAESVMKQMKASGLRPDTVHYASLIHAKGCVLHDMAGARALFDEVTRGNLVPADANLYQSLLEAMVANHEVRETDAVLAQMRATRVEMTPYIANTLIHGWTSENNVEKAREIYQKIGRERREPSTYEAMVRAYLAVEQRAEAQEVVSELLTRGYASAVTNKVVTLMG